MMIELNKILLPTGWIALWLPCGYQYIGS